MKNLLKIILTLPILLTISIFFADFHVFNYIKSLNFNIKWIIQPISTFFSPGVQITIWGFLAIFTHFKAKKYHKFTLFVLTALICNFLIIKSLKMIFARLRPEIGNHLAFFRHHQIGAKAFPSSHAAIIAKALNIPAVSGIHGLMDIIRCSESLLVDADKGLVYYLPNAGTVKSVMGTGKKAGAVQKKLSSPPGTSVMANAGLVEEMETVK